MKNRINGFGEDVGRVEARKRMRGGTAPRTRQPDQAPRSSDVGGVQYAVGCLPQAASRKAGVLELSDEALNDDASLQKLAQKVFAEVDHENSDQLESIMRLSRRCSPEVRSQNLYEIKPYKGALIQKL